MLIKAIFQTELLLLSFFMFSQVGGVEADLLFYLLSLPSIFVPMQ
jgi:hypothetical protein